jgi:hypothetical protein
MKNVHVLSTDKPSRLYQKENRFKLDTHPGIDWHISSASYKPVNIYITCDEEIKEGDLFYIKTPNIHGGNIVTKCLGFGKDCWSEHILTDTTDERGYHPSHCKKIILTTNQDLINDGVQPIEDDFLEWFVKNPSCEFVDTFIDAMGCAIEHCNANPCINYKIIFPQEELKQEYVKCTCANSLEYSNCGKKCERILDEQEPKQETIQKFIEKHGITEQQLIDGYKQGLDLIFENASKIDKQEPTLEEAKIDLTKLCYYDKRNPDFQIKEEYGYDKEEVESTGNFSKKDCACDNCFYGRSKLTEQLIWQQKRMYSKEEVIAIVEKSRETGLTAEYLLLTDQFKKK